MSEVRVEATPRRRGHCGVRLLVFCRGAVLGRFRAIFAPVGNLLTVDYLTDIRSDSAHSLKDAFYSFLDNGAPCPLLAEADLEEVVRRCRMLRRIERSQAKSLAHAMGNAIVQELKSLAPDCIATQMVDEYVSHLVMLLARKLDIPCFGFCAGYFPGSSLLLADENGRPLTWREPSLAEAREAHAAVAPATFRQNYNLPEAYSLPRHIRAMARYGLKRVAFAALRRLRRDYWNMHYAVTPYIAERRYLRDYPEPALFSADWRSDLSALQRRHPDKPVLYLPLSYFPEATIDYWVLDKRAIDYENFIVERVRSLSNRFIVVTKEHLHMMGARPRAFLEALRACEGVISVHPLEMSNHVVDRSDAILVGSGSPGIEATLRGKPVVSFCDTSYWFDSAGATFAPIAETESWPAIIEGAIAAHRPLDKAEGIAFVRDCLRASTRVLPSADPWPSLNPQDVIDLVHWIVERRETVGTKA